MQQGSQTTTAYGNNCNVTLFTHVRIQRYTLLRTMYVEMYVATLLLRLKVVVKICDCTFYMVYWKQTKRCHVWLWVYLKPSKVLNLITSNLNCCDACVLYCVLYLNLGVLSTYLIYIAMTSWSIIVACYEVVKLKIRIYNYRRQTMYVDIIMYIATCTY